VNSLFSEIAVQSMLLGEKEKDNLLQGCLFGNNVGMTATSSNSIVHDIKMILEH
jgi:hypothetical protein